MCKIYYDTDNVKEEKEETIRRTERRIETIYQRKIRKKGVIA